MESGLGWYYRSEDADPNRLFISLNKVIKYPTGAHQATEVHHMGKRRGKMLLDQTKWLAVSAEAHRRIEQDKSWARANGFLDNF